LADIAALIALIEPEAKALGFDLVRVAMFGGKSDPTLQIMAERPDTRQLDLSDCEALSRRVSEVLDHLEDLHRHLVCDEFALGPCLDGVQAPVVPQLVIDQRAFRKAADQGVGVAGIGGSDVGRNRH